MLLFAIFTLGYFGGVVTALAIFSPRTKEIEEQEKDALGPILTMSEDKGTEPSQQPDLTFEF